MEIIKEGKVESTEPLKFSGGKILGVMNYINDVNCILNKKCDVVTTIDKELEEFIDAMTKTLKLNRGLGLAAPQVGKTLQILVFTKHLWPEEKEDIVMINPELTVLSDEIIMNWEYCLSFPGMGKILKRYKEVQLKGFSKDMKNQFVLTGEGLTAVVMQHEFDHLQGITLYDKNE